MLFYYNRDRKNLRELKKTDFSFHGSGDNKYIALRDHSTKSHRGDSKDDNELFMWNLKKGHKRFAYSIEITKNSFICCI